MKNKQYPIIIVLALISGFIGSALSSYFFMGNPAFADKKSKPAKVIEAEEFRVVDKNGKPIAYFKNETVKTRGGEVVIYPILIMGDMNLSRTMLSFGNDIRYSCGGVLLTNTSYGTITIGQGGFKPPYIDISDEDGKVIWKAP